MKTFGAILAGVVVIGLGLAVAAIWAMVPAIAAATGGISLIIPLIAIVAGALVAGWLKFSDTIKDFLRQGVGQADGQNRHRPEAALKVRLAF